MSVASEGPWPLSATTEEVHLGGEVEFTLHYAGCGLPATITVAGVLHGMLEAESNCVEFAESGELEWPIFASFGYPVRIDGWLCLEAEGTLTLG